MTMPEVKKLELDGDESTAKIADMDADIEATKADIQNLIRLVLLRKKECDEMANETRYLKEYVASFISMGELQKQ